MKHTNAQITANLLNTYVDISLLSNSTCNGRGNQNILRIYFQKNRFIVLQSKNSYIQRFVNRILFQTYLTTFSTYLNFFSDALVFPLPPPPAIRRNQKHTVGPFRCRSSWKCSPTVFFETLLHANSCWLQLQAQLVKQRRMSHFNLFW